MSTGHIYQIRNTINDAVYIGSVLKRDPQLRWHNHRRDCRGNYHHSPHFQRAWNKYGESNFVFEILEKVDDPNNVLPREQWYLDDRKKNYPPNLNYNVLWTAGSPQGRKWSVAMRKKLSEAHKGMRNTPESIAKQVATWASKCNHPYSFTAPDGNVYSDVRNLRAFAREHNLGPNGRPLTLLHRGTIRSFKGWAKTGVPLSSYELCSPEGTTTRGHYLKVLCRKNNINYKMIHKYCIKRDKPYLGWTAKRLA